MQPHPQTANALLLDWSTGDSHAESRLQARKPITDGKYCGDSAPAPEISALCSAYSREIIPLEAIAMTRRALIRSVLASAIMPVGSQGQSNGGRSSGERDGFAVKFTLGGGCCPGARFEVAISGTHCSYHQIPGVPVRTELKFEREFSSSQLQDLQNFARGLKLLTLVSQDYTKQPLFSDQPTFSLSLSMDGRNNSATCGIPNAGEPKNECQKRLDQLKIYLNSLLNVKMF